MADKIYLQHYSGKLLRISYRSAEDYPKIATGYLIEDTSSKIFVKTVKDEVITIDYRKIDNIITLNKGGKLRGEKKDGDREGQN